MAARVLLSSVVALALFGCEAGGGGAVADAAADTVDTADAGSDVIDVTDQAPDFDRPASAVTVEVASWGLRLRAAFYPEGDGELHQEAGRSGLCRLMTYEASLCDPACDWAERCVDGACVAQPLPVSAGTLTLSGLGGGATATVAPLDVVGSYYWDTEAHTAASLDDALTVSAAGDAFGAFSLTASVASPVTPSDDWVAALTARADGEDVTLRWSDPLPGARVYLRMTTGIGTHGGISPVEVECEGPDVGALTLPGSYLDALYAEGWSCGECGGNDLWRAYVVEGDAGGDPVMLRVGGLASFWFHPIYE